MNTSCYHVLKANTSFVILYENTARNNVIQADDGDPRDLSILVQFFLRFIFLYLTVNVYVTII